MALLSTPLQYQQAPSLRVHHQMCYSSMYWQLLDEIWRQFDTSWIRHFVLIIDKFIPLGTLVTLGFKSVPSQFSIFVSFLVKWVRNDGRRRAGTWGSLWKDEGFLRKSFSLNRRRERCARWFLGSFYLSWNLWWIDHSWTRGIGLRGGEASSEVGFHHCHTSQVVTHSTIMCNQFQETPSFIKDMSAQ